MKRLLFCAVLLLPALWPADLAADGAALLVSGDLSSYEEAASGFRRRFGRPFKEYRLSGSEADVAATLGSVRSQSPEIVIAIGSKAAVEALNSISGTPLVYCMVVSPERQGLLNRKNVYGISFAVSESVLIHKYKTALPGLRRLGLIAKKRESEKWVREVSDEAKRSGMEIVAEIIDSSQDVPNAMRALSGKIDAFWMTTDPVVANKFAFNTISDFCANSRIPLLVPTESLLEAGGLLSVTSGESSMGGDAADLAKNILEGRRPDNPLVYPSKAEIKINFKTAAKIGINFPESVSKSSNPQP